MKPIRYCLCLLALTALLSACASTPAPGNTLFLLQQEANTTATQTQQAPATTTILALTPVQLAPYLTGEGIVYQTGANRIVIAGSNQWAAPLQSQLSDGLYQTLDQALANVDIRRPGLTPAGRDADFKLIVHVQQFQGRYDGSAVISGNWRLFDRDGEIAGRGAFDETTPLQEDGYAALVRALSAGWAQARQAMAQAIGKALAGATRAGS